MIRSERCHRSPLHPISETCLGKTFQFECRAGSPFPLVPRKNKSPVKSKKLICRIKMQANYFLCFYFLCGVSMKQQLFL